MARFETTALSTAGKASLGLMRHDKTRHGRQRMMRFGTTELGTAGVERPGAIWLDME